MSIDRESAFYNVYKSCPSFWSNYGKGCSWLKSHGFKPVNCPIVYPIEVEPMKDTSAGNHQINQVAENNLPSECLPKEAFDETNTDDDSCIDDDYIRFIIETRKHQKEQEKLKAERIKMEENEEIIYKDICEIDQQRLIGSAMELETGRKESDYLNLYGTESETIKEKEALLQSDFNVYCDTHNPPFWPTIPIII